MFKTLGFGSIDWHGVQRVLIHAGLLALGFIAMQGEGMILNHDWGSYAPLVMGVNTIVFTFLEKWLGKYNIPLQVPTNMS